jgi:NO-binding membrane sensor protein with MHYT domain
MTVNLALDPTTAMLTDLAQGRLDAQTRRELARRALSDPQLAAELKLALRLAAGSAEMSRDWVGVAARAEQAQGSWWRPLVGAAASLAIVAAVLSMPRMHEVQTTAPNVAMQALSTLPDQIGAGSFEAPELFGGSFERD